MASKADSPGKPASPSKADSPGKADSPRSQGIEATIQESLVQDPLQADDVLDDGDSAYAASDVSGSQVSSLESGILHYKYENGRRYHAFRDGAYLVPNDDDEQDRMDLGHHIYRLLLGGKLYLAPIGDSPQRVLDLGTGTGIWAMDFADEHPTATVLGTDLSPIQPKWTPPNCSFEVDDFEQDWAYHRPFDFIHARELGGCIADDVQLFSQAFQHLNSGGWFEIQAVYPRFLSDDGTADKATDAQLWMENILEGTSRFGKPLDSATGWAEKMKEAGFVDVQQEVYKVPIGAWPKDPKLKEIGRHQFVQEAQVIDSYTPAVFSRVLGWKEEEIQVLIAKVKNNLRDPSIHLYLPVYFIWGQKP